MTRRGAPRHGGLVLAALLGSFALGAGCGGAAPPDGASTPSTPAKEKKRSDFDPCAGQGPPAKVYTGVLREARCDQELYLTMAGVADALGTTCAHCHVQKPGGGANDFAFPEMTPAKEVGNWMKHQLVDKLRHKDGSPVGCDSCHVGKDGKRRAKFLGEPRDPRWAMEWMSLVMVNDFTLEDGSKLKCRHCHEAPPGTAGFRKDVIGRDLTALPARKDLPAPRPTAEPAAPADAGPTATEGAPADPGGAPPPAPSAAPASPPASPSAAPTPAGPPSGPEPTEPPKR